MNTKAVETISFISACVRFFGCKPGQSKLDLGKEVKALTEQDRKEMAPELAAALGVNVT